jgi:pimeloyl-ACP methyl ester carboxylesterase
LQLIRGSGGTLLLILLSYVPALAQAKPAIPLATVTPETAIKCTTKDFQSCSNPALVFIHGIFGSRETWINPDTNAYFPSLVANDAAFADFDVYRVDFQTQMFSSSRGPLGADVARSIFLALKPILAPYQTIHVIAHSLGGNYIRSHIKSVKLSTPTPPGPHTATFAYKNLIFLGTPMKGARIASLARAVLNDGSLALLVPIDVNDWLTQTNNDWILVVDRQKRPPDPITRLPKEVSVTKSKAVPPDIASEPFTIHAGYENRRTKGILVVDRTSGTALATEPNIKCFDLNHETISKPRDRDDPLYLWVRASILRTPGDPILTAPRTCP